MRAGMTLNTVAGLVSHKPDFGKCLSVACARYLLLIPAPQHVVRPGANPDEDVLVRDPYHMLRLAITQWHRFAELCTATHAMLSCDGPCKTLRYELSLSMSVACCAATIDEYISWLCQLERAVNAEYAPCVVKRAPKDEDDDDDEDDTDEEDDHPDVKRVRFASTTITAASKETN
jgi:hypothetical protein